jgi:hypothetical protein
MDSAFGQTLVEVRSQLYYLLLYSDYCLGFTFYYDILIVGVSFVLPAQYACHRHGEVYIYSFW